MTNWRTKIGIREALYAVILLTVSSEISSYMCMLYLGTRGIGYSLEGPGDYERSASQRHTLLGWPSPKRFGNGNFDPQGARVDPAHTGAVDESCVLAFGDSFTWGAEVENDETWPSYLSTLLGCKVANFGIGGYGTDQAYLRFRERERANIGTRTAQTVILGVLSENILRNLNQFRPFLVGRGRSAFKPRFLPSETDGIKLIHPPDLSLEEYESFTHSPNEFVLHEYFAPGGVTGVFPATFPYSLSLMRAFGHFRARAWLQGRGHWENFYRNDHPSKALELLTRIAAAFHSDVSSTGRIPIVVVFPLARDLMAFQESGKWPYQPFLDNLKARNILALNVGEGFISHLQGDDPCSLFTYCHGGHYLPAANKLAADLLFFFLRRNNVIVNNSKHRKCCPPGCGDSGWGSNHEVWLEWCSMWVTKTNGFRSAGISALRPIYSGTLRPRIR